MHLTFRMNAASQQHLIEEDGGVVMFPILDVLYYIRLACAQH